MSEATKVVTKPKNDTFNRNDKTMDIRMTNIQAAKGMGKLKLKFSKYSHSRRHQNIPRTQRHG